MRVQSDKPCKNGGWLHRIGEAPIARPVRQWRPTPTEQPDFDALLSGWRKQTDDAKLSWFARSLGVKSDSLRALNTCQSDTGAWAFPMCNGDGKTVGIRLRSEDGRKWAVKGSHQGLFLNNWPTSATALVCEGPTDTAAALDLGFWAIGRPSCTGNNDNLCLLLKRIGVRHVVIVADNDAPGINGAKRLACEIKLPCAMLIPPAKDLRQFVQLGGTAKMLNCLLTQLIWHTPEAPTL